MSPSRPPRPRANQVTKAAQAGEGSKRIWIVAAVVAVVAFAGIIAVAISQDADDGGEETAAVEITGERIADPESAPGQPMPEVSGTSVDGESMSIEADGRPKVISFLAHWCPYCRNEVPRVVDWLEAGNEPDDVDLVAVSTNVSPIRENYPPSEWLEREDWTLPTLMDDGASSTHAAFGGGGFPYFVVVDADGTIVTTRSGELAEGELDQLIEQARAGA
ncbi:TlpA family protein disulfide reductase [Actinomarinicola tropica]|uniref:Redoxin family protein n=1 Tax=Actinomarinicola tropica TaxID=2789776 RepID=A0A5Q2RNF5_9ACTN|nr:TlpA disulfide reductase family protein [Actinomarinicola tropica]QGG94725.1 redoxin family protein [Actinomarinicola tropica]